jgi:F0F1-type ATP synthase membrane subunit c/vacuolar-type H+-ATPase subunit K
MPLLGSACKAAIEGFTGTSEDPAKRKAIFTELLATLFAFILALVILGFVGKLLWNNVVIELFSFAKPARSFWQILGLMIFVSLVNP